ncbi:hypothetical protein [Parasitella parasitica]|uniref:Tc1-like transposase DDE domain-containing protein n=1 Tax=Parasitella parasitica TaxID=35722 RepID=A0A0B7MWY7_9FUNG|nr:hypothetical protein [Parasitella parasitica]
MNEEYNFDSETVLVMIQSYMDWEETAALKKGSLILSLSTILKDEHTVFIFELLANEPALTVVEAVTDHLSKEFRDTQITPRSVENHMKKKKERRLTYKRIIPRYYGRNTDETVAKRRDAVAYWFSQNIDFMNECVFLDEAGFNRSMHRSYGWSEAGTPCKIDAQTKGANVSILGAICKSGLITLSRKTL